MAYVESSDGEAEQEKLLKDSQYGLRKRQFKEINDEEESD